MVSTRHSSAPGTPLLSLETVASKNHATPSVPSKKRKFESETPDQKFVDARGTPFTQRASSKRTSLRLLPLNDENEEQNDDDENYETADELNDDLEISEGATAHADIGHSEKIEDVQSEQTDSDELPSEGPSDSDEDAPEAISNVDGALAAKAKEAARMDLLRKQEADARERRRNREQKLQEQQSSKRRKMESGDQQTSVIEMDDPSEPDNNKGRKKLIPRLLPDEILYNVQSIEKTPSEPRSKVSTHKRFEPKKETTSIQKGALLVKVFQQQRTDLAPKKSASTANTKNQWLYQRGQNKTLRRPTKKPLA